MRKSTHIIGVVLIVAFVFIFRLGIDVKSVITDTDAGIEVEIEDGYTGDDLGVSSIYVGGEEVLSITHDGKIFIGGVEWEKLPLEKRIQILNVLLDAFDNKMDVSLIEGFDS